MMEGQDLDWDILEKERTILEEEGAAIQAEEQARDDYIAGRSQALWEGMPWITYREARIIAEKEVD